MKIKTINPSTEETIKIYDVTSASGIKRTVANARKSFQKWKTRSIEERADILKSLSRLLKKRKKEYAETITTEMGKPIRESFAEIEKCSWLCDYYYKNAEKFLQDEIVKTNAKKSYVTFEPLGVVACIMPWNFPFWQVLRFAVPAITAGNTVVLKHSSICPGSALALVDLIDYAGFPKGIFQAVIGPAPIGELLIKSEINAVSVTGSIATGKRIAELASKDLKKFVLELGGSDPMIVLSDANMLKTCQGAVKGRSINAGQSCIAAKRFIVVKSRSKEFTEKFVELTENLVVGDPMSKKTHIGPLVRESARENLERQVNTSVKMGAKILTGGKRPEGKGYFYLPTVLTNVNKKMPVVNEETFGPVSPIIVAKNENHAIEIANDTYFGLGASIWTRNLKRGEKLAKRIEAGLVYVNSAVRSDPRMPFGGVKKSGIGRELSHYGIKEFVNIKSIKIF